MRRSIKGDGDSLLSRSCVERINGLRIHYRVWGSIARPVMMLLHGLGQHSHIWDPVARHFAKSHFVVAPDLRGHGNSDWHPDACYSVEGYSSDVVSLIRKLGIDHVVLIGCSLGGRVSQVASVELGSIVDALVCIDVGTRRSRRTARRIVRLLRSESEAARSWDTLVKHLVQRYPGVPRQVVLRNASWGCVTTSEGSIRLKRDPHIAKGLGEVDLSKSLKALKAPALFIVGGRSQIVDDIEQKIIRRILPGCTIVELANRGHHPEQECPDAVIRVLEEFVGGRRTNTDSAHGTRSCK